METFDREKRNAEVLARWSVFDLREQTDEDLAAAREMLLRARPEPEIIEFGVSNNCISFFLVESGANIYEVRRFETFAFCECEGFFYTQKACKHIYLTFPPVCTLCGGTANSHGGLCTGCAMNTAPYLKPSSNKVPEKIGNIRI